MVVIRKSARLRIRRQPRTGSGPHLRGVRGRTRQPPGPRGRSSKGPRHRHTVRDSSGDVSDEWFGAPTVPGLPSEAARGISGRDRGTSSSPGTVGVWKTAWPGRLLRCSGGGAKFGQCPEGADGALSDHQNAICEVLRQLHQLGRIEDGAARAAADRTSRRSTARPWGSMPEASGSSSSQSSGAAAAESGQCDLVGLAAGQRLGGAFRLGAAGRGFEEIQHPGFGSG